MKVLLLSGQLGPAGTPQVVLNVASNLSDDIELTVGYLGGKRDLVSEFVNNGIDVQRFGSKPLSIGSVTGLFDHLRRNDYDLVHTHMMVGGLVGRVVGYLTRTPVVSTIHTNYANRPFVARFPDLVTSPLAATNICVSASVEKSLPQFYALGSQVDVVHNCVDVPGLRERGQVSWDDLDWTAGVDPEAPLIVNVARYDPKKGRRDLVAALPELLQDHPLATVVLTGEGERKEALEQFAEQLGVAEHVAFIGFVENPQTVYHHANVVALPSLSEGFSISMLEAMAHGKPIVATDIPAFREALGAGRHLVPPESPGPLAEELHRVLAEPTYATAIGEQAYERVRENFSGAAAAQKYETLYNEVIERRITK